MKTNERETWRNFQTSPEGLRQEDDAKTPVVLTYGISN